MLRSKSPTTQMLMHLSSMEEAPGVRDGRELLSPALADLEFASTAPLPLQTTK
jgi:hypothetical protein